MCPAGKISPGRINRGGWLSHLPGLGVLFTHSPRQTSSPHLAAAAATVVPAGEGCPPVVVGRRDVGQRQVRLPPATPVLSPFKAPIWVRSPRALPRDQPLETSAPCQLAASLYFLPCSAPLQLLRAARTVPGAPSTARPLACQHPTRPPPLRRLCLDFTDPCVELLLSPSPSGNPCCVLPPSRASQRASQVRVGGGSWRL